ncbi:MAG TPA: ceramidase domain-containing protein [Methylococcaceae bacterium]|nr:ceramidase domain-containing protein [Methylococcaceae bacterium]
MLVSATMTNARWRLRGLLLFALATTAVVTLRPPVGQPQAYHHFADARAFLGLPNFLNVISNLPFLLVAMLGLAALRQPRPGAFVEETERVPWAVFFLGLAGTGLGSTWYHLAPDNARLFWDRLPMSLSFGALLSALIAERVSVRAALALVAPLVATGIGTVWYWRFSQAEGAENVLPYFAFEGGTIVALVFLVSFSPPAYTREADLLRAGVLYAAAVFAEFLDPAIFAVGRMVSGHTLKHLLAALAVYQLVRMLRARSAISGVSA